MIRACSLVVAAAVVMAGCSVPADEPGTVDGLVIAENVGAVLAVLSIAPADVGANQIRLDVVDASERAAQHSARITLSSDAHPVTVVPLDAGPIIPFIGRRPARGTLVIPGAGTYELQLRIDGVDGSADIELELPARRAPTGMTATIDRAMNELRSYRELQTLTSRGPVYDFRYEYRAPDRLRYTFSAPGIAPHETIIVGARRWDRELGGHMESWTASDGGAPIVVPAFAYDARPANVYVIGGINSGMQSLDVIALIDLSRSTPVYYRLWIDRESHRVERYVMMAAGHYMRGSYSDFDAAIEIAPQ